MDKRYIDAARADERWGTEKSFLKSIDVDEHEYPRDQIEESGGIALDTTYGYVSSSFLNGLVNYGKGHVAFLIGRYGLDHDMDLRAKYDAAIASNGVDAACAEIKALYQAFADQAMSQIHAKFNGDDWLVMYETSNSYMWLWYDRDCSDCCIDRYSKESCSMVGIESLDQFIHEALIKYSESAAEHCRDYTSLPFDLLIQPAKLPSGWLSG